MAPSPPSLAKNEREGHRITPFSIPAWIVDGVSHPLCPVSALKAYLEATPQASLDRLFVWPTSLQVCSKQNLSTVICKVIDTADPGHRPVLRDIRHVGVILEFLRHHSVGRAVRAGQWSSSHSFSTRYLSLNLQDVACVARVHCLSHDKVLK